MNEYHNTNCPNYDNSKSSLVVKDAYCLKDYIKPIKDADCVHCYFSNPNRNIMCFDLYVSEEDYNNINWNNKRFIITTVVDDYRKKDLIHIKCSDDKTKPIMMGCITYVDSNNTFLGKGYYILEFKITSLT